MLNDLSLKNLRGIVVFDSTLTGRAQQLAEEFQLPLFEQYELLRQKSKARTAYCKELLRESPEQRFVYFLTAEGIQLLDLSNAMTIMVDFCHGKANHRRIYGGGTGQMIAKAVGIKAKLRPRVLDATAGLGQDSFVLASLGCQLTMLERSAIVHVLLKDGLERAEIEARDDAELSEVISRMQLINANARDHLLALANDAITLEQRPQVVYLDPMFPERKKSAQVKKEMQSFHHVVGNDLDADDLLEPAKAVALARVVVKRPKIAPFLGMQKPDHQLIGKSSRYDIYINQALEKS
ncbi:class I SAM-dependent methyltransferase [uncultured Pseudoteredinibacter sp.]|uniref:class I SAM-dependent methyltransferase n=1 Tax=uncultured Pseudoteredinibacter sp. TaxID=1641701 RepID=UPI0026203BE2|nr:class I SAM-dependent methyltransferase [uncultured Pseudoteredinibacter sp.]